MDFPKSAERELKAIADVRACLTRFFQDITYAKEDYESLVLTGTASLLLQGLKDVEPMDIDFVLRPQHAMLSDLDGRLQRSGALLEEDEELADGGRHLSYRTGDVRIDLLIPWTDQVGHLLWGSGSDMSIGLQTVRVADPPIVIAMKIVAMRGKGDFRHAVAAIRQGLVSTAAVASALDELGAPASKVELEVIEYIATSR